MLRPGIVCRDAGVYARATMATLNMSEPRSPFISWGKTNVHPNAGGISITVGVEAVLRLMARAL